MTKAKTPIRIRVTGEPSPITRLPTEYERTHMAHATHRVAWTRVIGLGIIGTIIAIVALVASGGPS